MTETRVDRRSPRLGTAVQVRDASDPNAGPWLTRDLSATGLFLLAPARWTATTEVELIIEHGATRLEVSARVTEAGDEGLSMEFVAPGAELVRAILEIMADRFAAGDPVSERRSDLRWPIDLPVVWRDEDQEFRARVKDLSLAGARLLCAQIPAPGTFIYLLLPMGAGAGEQMPWRAIMGCRARVVGPTKAGFGVELMEPSEELRENIVRLLARR